MCAHAHTRALPGGSGGKKIAVVIAFLENGGLVGGSCCSRLARAGVQVLKTATGPEIVTLTTVILVAVQQQSSYSRCCPAKPVVSASSLHFSLICSDSILHVSDTHLIWLRDLR